MAKFYENIEVQGTVSASTIVVNNKIIDPNASNFTGGTVTGQTFFTSGVTITGDTLINDTSGITALDTSTRGLVSSNSQPSIDWESRQLIDENGLGTLVWSSQKTLQDLFGTSLDWGNKYLYKSDGSVVLDWENGIITGQTNIESSIISATTISATTLYVSGNSITQPYKVYTALLTQTGTSAPTATVLENTLGLNPTYYYNSTGAYYLEDLSGLFTTNKTFVLATGTGSAGVSINVNDTNTIEIGSINMNQPGGGVQDGMFNNASLEIRVYN